MELDFSKLKALSYRGFEDAKEEKDTLTEQGHTVIEGEKMPFPEPPAQGEGNTNPPAETPPERKFTGKERNYKAMYRAAWDFHERHNPPEVDPEYWKDHSPGIDIPPRSEEEYWSRAAKDVRETGESFNNDPFLIGLLVAIYGELGREYNAARERISGKLEG